MVVARDGDGVGDDSMDGEDAWHGEILIESGLLE